MCEAVKLNQDGNCLVVIYIGLSFSFCLLDSASDSSIAYVAAKKISSKISFVAYLPRAVVIRHEEELDYERVHVMMITV